MKYGQVLVLIMLASLALSAHAQPERVERGQLVLEDIPEIPAELYQRLQQYQNTRSASFADWLHDGGLLISTRFGDTRQIHRVRRPTGAREQLTFFPEPLTNAAVSPDESLDGFVYTRDVGGNEFYQLYWFDFASGESRLLSDGESRNTGPTWSNDGGRFAYASTRRDGRNYDIYVATPGDTHETHRRVLEGEGLWVPMDWSPDDSRLLVINYRSITESEIWTVDLATGERSQVYAQDEPVGFAGAAFDASGEGVYVIHDHGAEFKQLHHLEVVSGETTGLSTHIPWDVSSMTLSPDRERLAFAVNEGGMSKLHLLEVSGARVERLEAPELPVGLIAGLSFDPDGEVLAMTLNTPQSPSASLRRCLLRKATTIRGCLTPNPSRSWLRCGTTRFRSGTCSPWTRGTDFAKNPTGIISRLQPCCSSASCSTSPRIERTPGRADSARPGAGRQGLP